MAKAVYYRTLRRLEQEREERKKSLVRADLFWKGLLESFLYPALEIFYPELYAAVDLEKPPIPVNRKSRVSGIHKASKGERNLNLLMDIPLKTGELLQMLLYVEVQEAGTKEPLDIQMHDSACAITLTRKRSFAALAIRTIPQRQAENLTYEMNCFGTRHTFTYPTVFIDQMDEQSLIAKKGNPVALAAVYAKWISKAKRDERKRYQYAKDLLTAMQGAEYSEDATLGLLQFIEGMAGLRTTNLKSALKSDLEQEISKMLGKGKDMKIPQTPILRKILRKKAQETFLAEGKAEGKLECARRMLSRGIELEIITDVTELSEEEIRNLRD
jgi:hypothetical protein